MHRVGAGVDEHLPQGKKASFVIIVIADIPIKHIQTQLLECINGVHEQFGIFDFQNVHLD